MRYKMLPEKVDYFHSVRFAKEIILLVYKKVPSVNAVSFPFHALYLSFFYICLYKLTGNDNTNKT